MWMTKCAYISFYITTTGTPRPPFTRFACQFQLGCGMMEPAQKQ
jgi:hypothetical protein